MSYPKQFKLLIIVMTLFVTACQGAQTVSQETPIVIAEPESSPTSEQREEITVAPSNPGTLATKEAETSITEEPEAKIEPNLTVEPTVVGPSQEQAELLATLEDRGQPPELHNEVWLNSEPLKLADLEGQVVLIEFWTFG